ncbi:hypothetical protein NECAME_07998 [Necator americanus]|uniref:Uncharacterized protein n=1 Tax=Necator americanus TaxID=51031 RepID=W2TKP9_NECAM|nr:hypothetical protein NECAME_07998 [Necator americanus]ETN82348.1 hypothetical protein NECAME_07998 [Necator americanus]
MELHDSSETSEPLWDKTTFDATSALPTQLIGFTVSDFESNEAATKTGLKVRVFSRREAKNSTTYALDTAVKVLDLLQEYFNTPLSNNKLGFHLT